MQSGTKAKTRLINGLSGAIGGILCYAIAAKIARPDATVIAGMGDGTVGFHLGELETAARENANIVALVCNDALWNAEHQIQIRDYGEDRTYGCGILPDARYDLVAEALGCHGSHVTDEAEIDAALSAGSIDKAVLLVVTVALVEITFAKFECLTVRTA